MGVYKDRALDDFDYKIIWGCVKKWYESDDLISEDAMDMDEEPEPDLDTLKVEFDLTKKKPEPLAAWHFERDHLTP